MSSVEENKRLARRFLDLVSEHDVEALCGMVAASWTMRGWPPGLPPGPGGLRELFRTFGEIDQTWTIDDVIAKGDKVVVRATNRCVQESFWASQVAASGRRSVRSSFIGLPTEGSSRRGATPTISDDCCNSGLGSGQRRQRRK
jgi:hypothetical protein